MAGPQYQNFTYDPLDRLLRGYTNGGTGAYDQSFAYNQIGNIDNFAGTGYGYGQPSGIAPGAKPHAVTHLAGVQKYWYDANGNQTKRISGSTTYTQTYDVEGRLITVTNGTTVTVFTYDGDGKRVKQTVAPTTTVFIGNYGEIAISGTQRLTTTYYYANGQRVAMRTAAGVTYVHSDHLRSTSVTSGVQSGDIKYFPYGATRSGAVGTTYKFTGQRLDDSTGLYFYNARYYDQAIGRFIQPDTVVPEPGNPQALNRYTYVRNNPLRYVDPTGYWTFGLGVGFTAGLGLGVSGSVLVVFDNKGNVGLILSGGGGGYAGIGAGGVGMLQVTSAPTIQDLNGFVVQFGGSVILGPDIGAGVGAEWVVQKGPEGPIHGLNFNVGPAGNVPIPFEIHGLLEYGKVIISTNISHFFYQEDVPW